MENVWAILCSKAIVDKRTNMMTLIEAIDVVEGEFPVVDGKNPVNIGPISIQLASFWYRTDMEKPETGKAKHTLLGPNGEELGQHEIEIDLQESVSRYGIATLPSLPYAGIGLYRIQIEKMDQRDNSWTRTASLPLLLRSKPKPKTD